METMLFADEVIPPESLEELAAGDGEIQTSDRELAMANQLIDSLASDFEPEKYRDEYRERVLDLIERKAQGETIVIEEPEAEPEKVPDLMAALEASIASAKKPAPKKKSTSAKKKKEPAKA
jgi:DNA end-binding protein Ku